MVNITVLRGQLEAN